MVAFPVVLVLAELCSAYSTSGGLYYFVSQLTHDRYTARLASWVTCWFSLFALVAVVAWDTLACVQARI